jgi:16S rRNA (uracil1498-N3)-methyltransferase
MPQFLIKKSDIHGDEARIIGSDARHIATVLRLKAGDWIRLTDGEGGLYRAVITASSPKLVSVKLKPLVNSTGGVGRIVLAQALTKHDKFEWVIQKSVELGCQRIIPFVSDRVVPRFAASDSRLVRFGKIAEQAAKQCGAAVMPQISDITDFAGLLKDFGRYSCVVFFWEGEEKKGLRDIEMGKGDVLVVIGPEGGFSEKEVALAREKGATIANLGPLILRTETAAIAAVTLVQYKLGYFDVER